MMQNKEMKKIFFIAPANNIHTVRWVNELSNYYEVHLVFCKNHDIGINKVNEKVILHPLKISAPWGYYLNVFELKKLYKKIKPDLVNIHYASGYGTLGRCSRFKPIIVSIWGSDVYDFPNKSKLNKKILQKNILCAKAIASTSYVMAEELKRQVPQYKKEIHITPFGVDIDKFKRIEVERNDSNINIVNIKALEKKYGIRDLILSIKKMKQNLKKNGKEQLANKIKLYIYGDGSERKNLENLIKTENLTNSVYLKGKVSNTDVPKILNNMDIFCATSILNSESFGVAVVEAMACELPVVATKVDGFSEVIEDKETGYLVEIGNIEEIASKLEMLLEDEQLRRKIGKNGRKRVEEKYNWKNNVEKMRNIYNMYIEEGDK